MTAINFSTTLFTKEELTCHCGCGRFNYDQNFLFRLLGFRVDYGKPLTTTSGGRCVKHNREEGGVDTSLHECQTKPATAIDVTGDDCEAIFKAACLSGLFNEVEWHKTDGKNFVHLGWDKKQKGNSFKVI